MRGKTTNSDSSRPSTRFQSNRYALIAAPIGSSLKDAVSRRYPPAPAATIRESGAPRADANRRRTEPPPTRQQGVALRGRRLDGLGQPGVEGAGALRRLRAKYPRRLWKLMPLATISTPSSRSGASARPAARCRAGSSDAARQGRRLKVSQPLLFRRDRRSLSGSGHSLRSRFPTGRC